MLAVTFRTDSITEVASVDVHDDIHATARLLYPTYRVEEVLLAGDSVAGTFQARPYLTAVFNESATNRRTTLKMVIPSASSLKRSPISVWQRKKWCL